MKGFLSLMDIIGVLMKNCYKERQNFLSDIGTCALLAARLSSWQLFCAVLGCVTLGKPLSLCL